MSGDMTIYVTNESSNEFVYVGKWGTSIKGYDGTSIKAGSYNVAIGSIEIPSMGLHPKGNRGWWYVQDTKNQATFELYAYCDPIYQDRYNASIGLKANCSHGTNTPTPNQAPDYLECSRNDKSFTFTIKSTWTDNSPKYIFNFGNYGILYPLPEHKGNEMAAHSFVVVRSFNGNETISFECWGGVARKPGQEPDLHYPAETFLAGEYELILARTICCFDPNDTRTDYKHRSGGKLKLGDCSGIIYGRTGVCHQMANRICAAVTSIDVGDRADMAAYNASHAIWGTYGGGEPVAPSKVSDLINKAFPDVISDEELKRLDISAKSDYPVNLLFKPWETYFEECKKQVKKAGYKKNT